jgi:deoxycytidylate deaminase
MNLLIPRIELPELVFGFVAPIGVEVDRTVQAFHSYFKGQGYDVINLKVTDVFQFFKKYITPAQPLETFPPEKRYRSYISYGDQVRNFFADDSILAATSIARIITKRAAVIEKRKKAGDTTEIYSKTVFLLHQFKRKEEIDLLQSVYGSIFFQVSVYSRRGARVDNLARKFAAGNHSTNINQFRAEAEAFVQIDENEANDHGQEVGKIFHNADFILNMDQHDPSAETQVERFCELLFSSNCISPTKMEHGMFLAQGAALRSVDLSRQVGACVLDHEGQVVCLGANEVPKAKGGTYWADGTFDDRDFMRGGDANEQRKKEILSDLLKALEHKKGIDEVLENQSVRNSQLMDALEYSRVIHAEMNAICDAARQGHSLQNTDLYCTTFPCHMCAKHIIAAGISKVVFLEPYPKSLTFQLHNDSVEIEAGDRGTYSKFPSVQFVHFFGVTPRRYQLMFARGRRKDGKGNFVQYANGKQRPIVDLKSPAYTQPESIALELLGKKYIEKLGALGPVLAAEQVT